MATVRVPVVGTVGKAVRINPDATEGATLGINLYDENGDLLTLEGLAGAISPDTDVNELSVTLWSLIREVPPNIVSVAELSTVGLVTRQTSGDWVTRAIAAASARISVANGDGDSANPTLDVVEAAVNHNALLNYVPAQHIDWTVDAGVDINDANISQTSVTQHQAALAITESQITDLQPYLLDAPIDGVFYGRRDGAWTEGVTAGGSVTVFWNFDTTVTPADPGVGNFRVDNLVPASVTQIYVSTTSGPGRDLSGILAIVKPGDRFYIQNGLVADEFLLVSVDAITDNTTWFQFDVTVENSGTTAFTNAAEFGWLVLWSSGSDVVVEPGTVTDATLRWNGSAWVQGPRIRSSVAGALQILDTGQTSSLSISHGGSDVNFAHVSTTNWNITGLNAIQAGGVDLDVDALTATSYGGILEANLLDRAAAEIVSGLYTFNAGLVSAGEIIANSGGSQSDPQIRFDNSTTTGIYSPAANNLSFTAAGDRKFYMDTTGVYTDVDFSVTGNIAVTGTVDGVDIAALSASNALKAPIASPTFTGTVSSSGQRAFWATTNGSFAQVGGDGSGQAGNVGSRINTDAAANYYSTYWAYDCYWNDTTNEWVANRTSLARKWKTEMGYHSNSFDIDYYNGVVTAPWAESAWTNLLNLTSGGNLTVAGGITATGYSGIVAEDVGSGNLGAGVVPYINGTDASANYRMVFSSASGASGNSQLFRDLTSNLTYNPALNTLSVPTLTSTDINVTTIYNTGNYLNLRDNAAGPGGIDFLNSAGVRQGLVYHDGSGTFGLLNDGGGWAFQVISGGTEITLAAPLVTVNGTVRASDALATSGNTIIEGRYSGDNVLNVWGAERSSGASYMAYAVRARTDGVTGFESSAGNSSFERGIFDISGRDFTWSYANTSTTAIGTPITMTDLMVLDPVELRAGTYRFAINQAVGAGQDNYVLTYDNASGRIALEPATGGVDFAASGLMNSGVDIRWADAAQPWLTLDSSSAGDNWTSQGAGISVGEAGKRGNAAIHMTYNGDGSGYLGMGTVDNTAVTGGRPAFGHFDFTYNTFDIKVGGRLFPGSSVGAIQGTKRIESSTGYGSINVVGGGTGNYAGYAINNTIVFMSNGTTHGIFNVAGSEWLINGTTNGNTIIYYNNVSRVTATSVGATIGGVALADSFTASTLGPLTAPAVADAYVGGYGLMGNRAGAVYLTNANATGTVSINAGGVHGAANARFVVGVSTVDSLENFRVRDGNQSRVYDSGNDDYIYLEHNDTQAVIGTAGTGVGDVDISVRFTGTERALFRESVTTGETSYMALDDHGGGSHDVGFNVLPAFNFNLSDTLEAGHCGHSTGKTTTTVYTLTGPTSTNLDFPVGGVCTVMNLGTSGNYNISDTTTCTMRYCDGSAAPVDIAGTGALAPGGIVTLYRYSSTAIYIFGSGFTP